MNRRQSARLDRKKFFADPVMLGAIFVLIVFLSLFILYPLAMLMIDSVYVRDTKLLGAQSLLSGASTVLPLLFTMRSAGVAVSAWRTCMARGNKPFWAASYTGTSCSPSSESSFT